jgi:probable rRNA maturation factor
MTILYENETGDSSIDYEKIAGSVILQAMDYCECPYEAEVDVTLVGEDEIRTMNRETRDIDRVTDVLSFPLAEYEQPAVFDEDSLMEQHCFHPETGELMLGDIVICVPRMKQQAEEYGHGIRREFAFLVAHSMLHLFGYDHMQPDEAAQMEQMQEEILTQLGITRN